QPDRLQVRGDGAAARLGALLRDADGSARRDAACDPRRPPAGGDGATRALTVSIAAGAVALAAIASFHHDLAIDEPFTALAIAQPSALGTTLVHDNVPLYYVLLLGWTRLFGQSALALRAMSMAAFAGAILFTAAAARRAGPLAATLVACSVAFGLQPAAV